MRYFYWIVSTGALGLLLLEAPMGSLLTAAPERGKVGTGPSKSGKTVRGRGPGFIWLGGGYRGGK